MSLQGATLYCFTAIPSISNRLSNSNVPDPMKARADGSGRGRAGLAWDNLHAMRAQGLATAQLVSWLRTNQMSDQGLSVRPVGGRSVRARTQNRLRQIGFLEDA